MRNINNVIIFKNYEILIIIYYFIKFESKFREMTKKYQNKYRIESARKKGYDYSQNGAYFITIVTKNRECFFGDIVDGKMQLSEIGKIVWDEWFASEKIRNHIFMDEFVIMPNHIHGIVIINNDDCRDALQNVSTTDKTDKPKNKFFSKISPSSKSLSMMVRQFKSAVTIKSREINPDFAWQPRFHDRIIRNENELNRIRHYIRENPVKWYRDRNNGNLWL